jgi:uncharacterized damage-inducible protein DinB
LADSSPMFAAVLDGWKEYHEQLVKIVRGLTEEQLAWRDTPQLRSVGEILGHVVTARVDWFSDFLGEGGEAEHALMGQNTQMRLASSHAELVEGLEVTWRLVEHAITRWTPEQIAEPIIVPGFERHPVSRAWVTWHVLEHDLHHGGEVTLLLGTHGMTQVKLPPPPPDE